MHLHTTPCCAWHYTRCRRTYDSRARAAVSARRRSGPRPHGLRPRRRQLRQLLCRPVALRPDAQHSRRRSRALACRPGLQPCCHRGQRRRPRHPHQRRVCRAYALAQLLHAAGPRDGHAVGSQALLHGSNGHPLPAPLPPAACRTALSLFCLFRLPPAACKAGVARRQPQPGPATSTDGRPFSAASPSRRRTSSPARLLGAAPRGPAVVPAAAAANGGGAVRQQGREGGRTQLRALLHQPV